MTSKEIIAKLCAPFPPELIEMIPGRGGEQFASVDARAYFNRLDEQLPFGWRDSYRMEEIALPGGEKVPVCVCTLELSIDGQWIPRSAGATIRFMTEKVHGEQKDDIRNSVKTMFTESFKLAAAKFGIGRYLYRQGVPDYAVVEFQGEDRSWVAAPDPTVSSAQEQRRVQQAPARPPQGQQQRTQTGPPKTGSGLWKWLSDEQQRTNDPALKDDVIEYGRTNGFAGRMVDWTPEQVAKAYAWLQNGDQANAPNPGRPNEPASRVDTYDDQQEDDIPF
jgi:hypothetical protein